MSTRKKNKFSCSSVHFLYSRPHLQLLIEIQFNGLCKQMCKHDICQGK
uniref:Uncharacterized protein n=1 Tax=Rhizophora mucronata TaxID=61149 RepID=A0A2P2QXB3_RHIMU